MNAFFPATRTMGQERLFAFLPRAGAAYARERNFDHGPEKRKQVSGLSPYIRRRMLTEQEVVRAVLEQHTARAAEKFIQEVFWRTYWKGWLAMRPGVWKDYRADLDRARDLLQQETGLAEAYRQAVEGQTGLGCFDAWARELVEHGYLHNHARMWFASIWVFTLKLPWVLGADFFYRHLLDADPASNTLSWRWVAGLHTRGKHYVARASNIEKFTGGRFAPYGQLEEAPEPLIDDRTYPRVELAEERKPDPNLRTGHLVTEYDLAPLPASFDAPTRHLAFLAPVAERCHAPPASRFAREALEDARARYTASFDGVVHPGTLAPEEVSAWARQAGLEQVAVHDPGVGDLEPDLRAVEAALARDGLGLVRPRRAWDATLFPHAIAGYFRFKKCIPGLVARLSQE